MVNLKDLFRGGEPKDDQELADSADGAGAVGEDLVPDFTEAADYIEDVEEKDAESAYAPSEALGSYAPGDAAHEAEPERTDGPGMTAVGQPVYRSEPIGDEEPADAMAMGVSLISKEATVLGDIVTEGHIDIVGKVRGNVDAEGNVAVRGLVSGNMSGDKIGLYKCRVKGDLNAATGVVIDSDSVIIGDIDTENVVLGGKLKGDIKAMKMAVIRSDAYFLGDVETESLAVESGAVVNGNVKTVVHGDLEAPFDD